MRRRRGQASRATRWGALGALLLAAGCFAPVAARSAGDAVTLLSTGSILARLILVAALSSLALLLLRRRRALLVPALAAGLMVLAEFLAFQADLIVVSGQGMPSRALFSSFVNESGWALLVAGIVLLLLAGLFPGRSPSGRSA